MDILTYALAKSYTDKALLGVGTIKGAPCTVKSQTEDDEYVYVTLGWENSLGTSEETVVKIKKGVDGAPGEPGPAGDPGPQGISITKIEKIKTEDLIDTYQISFSDNTTFEYTISNGSTDYLNITNKPSIEGVELTGNKTFKDLNIASADALTATDENLQNLSNLIGDKTSLPAPTDTVVNNIASVDAKVDAIIDDNETGLAKTFSSDKITKTFATLEEVNERIPQYDVLPAPTEAFGGKVVQFIGATTEDYVHNYFYECTQVEGNYKWVNVAVQNIPTKVSELTNDSNFVTETELNAKGYLTEHQDLSAYATKEEIPTVPSKVSELSNDSNYQTAEQVNSTVTTEIAKIVADAPEDLNTLKEMSDWIAGHEDNASAMNSAISDNKTAITALQTGKADKSEIPTSLPANGGNADTVNKHTVKSDVPENAVFTDTVYDDTEVKGGITELSSNLTSEISRAKETEEVLKSRIDTITSLPEGSTTADAELKDIRVKADGTTATSAGNAVREQVSELKSDLVNLIGSEVTYNLDWILNEYVQKDGVFASYSGWKRTDYTEIPSGETELFFDVEITYNQEYNCFYDENNTLITAFSITTSKKVSIPQNAKYFVLSCPKSLNNDVYGSHIDGEIDNIKNEINDMKSDGIPSYYREHLSSKAGIIRGRNEYSVNGDSFVFITDYHREHNTENSIPLVKSIVENTGTHFVAFGGDAYNSRASKDSARQYIRDFCKKFDGIPCDTFFTVGNHEYNTEEIKLSQNDVYTQMLKRNEFKYVSTDGLDYAFDNETKRIRYIVYGCQQNAGIFTFQVVWLAQQLRDLPNNYNVVMISHVGVSDDGTTNHAFLNETLAVINAFKTKSQIYKIDTNYDYSNTTSNFLFIISGHSHRDCVVTLDNGIKIISTTCDAYRGECGGLTRTQGTITEQAFDVVNFNLEKRVVYLTRIGAGEDREISY